MLHEWELWNLVNTCEVQRGCLWICIGHLEFFLFRFFLHFASQVMNILCPTLWCFFFKWLNLVRHRLNITDSCVVLFLFCLPLLQPDVTTSEFTCCCWYRVQHPLFSCTTHTTLPSYLLPLPYSELQLPSNIAITYWRMKWVNTEIRHTFIISIAVATLWLICGVCCTCPGRVHTWFVHC